jgi:hypothetical protein
MYRLSYVEPRSEEGQDWRRAAAGICLDVGAMMVGLGLLYWGLLVAHATSLSHRWFLGLYDAADPLASLGDPFMWALWSVYWFLAVELVVRGVRERRVGKSG